MTNPFEVIMDRLEEISSKLEALGSGKAAEVTDPIEVIDRAELCKRLAVTEPTVIRWAKKGRIPEVRIGSCVRYNWPAVVKSLETKGK